MNDVEREQWILNYEPLYVQWQRSRRGISVFVRSHRKEIDDSISKYNASMKPRNT